MSLGLVVLVVGQGFSSIGAVRAVEDVALGVLVVAALMGAVAFVAVRHGRLARTGVRGRVRSARAQRSETLAREGLAVDPDENEFLELDPLNDEDFEELVRDALDDLPDLLRNALTHVAVVISDGGRRRGAYGLYQGGQTRRDDTHDRIVIFRDTLRRDFGHDADLLRDQVTRTVRHELAHHVGFDELGVSRWILGVVAAIALYRVRRHRSYAPSRVQAPWVRMPHIDRGASRMPVRNELKERAPDA